MCIRDRRQLIATPLQHDLDLIRTVMLQRVFEFGVIVPVRDEIRCMFVPAGLCLDEVIHSQLEVIVRCIDAPYHDLVTQHEASHELRSIYPQRTVTRWYAGHNVHAIDGQCIDEAEFESADPCRLEDQVDRLALVNEVIWRDLTSI